MITVVVLLLLVPFVALRDYFGKIGRLDPRSAALTKASHGAGMLALGSWAYLERDRLGLTVFDWVPLALLGLAAFGLFWLAMGWRAARIYGPVPGIDEFLTARSVAKLAIGAGLWWLPGADESQGPLATIRQFVYSSTGQDLWALLNENAGLLRFAASWCFVTGLTKIVLLRAVKPRLRPLPPVEDDRHGAAGNAGYSESWQAAAHGGRKTRLDDMQF
jgi:hypothetical protein